MRYVTLSEVLAIHLRVAERSGGSVGVRDLPGLESSLAQPKATFDGTDLYPELVDKAAAMAFSMVSNHPFIDGNKRTAHAALEVMLVLNGWEINAPVDEQERLFLDLASGLVDREELVEWIRAHMVSIRAR